MAENSKIEWTDHTFNPWIGCAKVSPGCKHCYAETLMDTRYGRVEWGVNGTRVRTGDGNWKKPLQWNRQAEKEGRRFRVFCASLADVCEDREDLVQWREELKALIRATPRLDWLILTKRPENLVRMFGSAHWLNVWFGTSVENQAAADERIPHLLRAAHLCRFTFLSCEPLIGPVRLYYGLVNGIDWVIGGGESGQGARRMEPSWIGAIHDECAEAGVAFLFKQWGEYDEAGNKVGKHAAGRLLDGREHNGFPDLLQP